MAEHHISERHVCALVGLSRDNYRNESQTSALNLELREQIVQTAHSRRRWGYHMIDDVLSPSIRVSTTSGCTASTQQEDCRLDKRKKARSRIKAH